MSGPPRSGHPPSRRGLDARGLFSLLFHGDKAIDVIETAYETGLLRALDAGPVSLDELATSLEMVPMRLYKLLDCLESLGVVEREQPTDAIADARYRSCEPLERAAELVVGTESIERDRNRQPWREVHGRLGEIVRGRRSVSHDAFAWPPATPEQQRRFEQSMAAGLGPIVESLAAARELWGGRRVLDVGGGDGSLACELVARDPDVRVDVLNLPMVEPMVRERIARSPHAERLGFVAGDFLEAPLPPDYDVHLFVRVLHDWPAETSRTLLRASHDALAPGSRIVITEEMRTPARLAVQFFWTYFLVGVDACVSRLREAEWYRDALGTLGFASVEVREGGFDLVTAIRP